MDRIYGKDMEMERKNMEMERKNVEMEGSGMEGKEGIIFYHQSYFVSSSFDFLLFSSLMRVPIIVLKEVRYQLFCWVQLHSNIVE